MKRKLVLGYYNEEYTLIWEEGSVSIEDLDVEAEMVAVKLTGESVPYNYYFLKYFLKELDNKPYEKFDSLIADFEFSGRHQVPSDIKDISKSLAVWHSEVPTIESLISLLPRDVVEWHIDKYGPDLNYSSRYILGQLALRANLNDRLMGLLAKTKSERAAFVLASNPKTPQHLMLGFIEGGNERVCEEALLHWRGRLPHTTAMTVLEKHGGIICIILAAMEIDEEVQLFLIGEGDSMIMAELARNPNLTAKAAELLFLIKDPDVQKAMSKRTDLLEQIAKKPLAPEKEI